MPNLASVHAPTSRRARHARPDRPRRHLAAIPVALTTLAVSLVVSVAGVIVDPSAAPVIAAGTPNIVVTKTADARTLIGATTTVTLQACNPTLTDGFNLSYRDVIPTGLALTAATPAPTRIVANQPVAGATTLIWENVSDLLAGSCNSVTYGIDTNPDNVLSTNQVGSTFGSAGSAYVNTDPFTVPDFDAAGNQTTDDTGDDSDGPTVTTIAAFIAEKDAGNAGEGELLRGVHGSEPKTYTLRVRNNPETATNDFTVVDVLPASLEFLGCESYTSPGYVAGTDNTLDAPTNETVGAQTEEYPGSGRMVIGPTSATCLEPTTIETLANGSTRVTWSSADLAAAGDLAANGVLTITYLAGIPLRENTNTWTGTKPSDASLGQGRNLDNNSGAPTSENASEPGVTNSLSATGTYQGPSTSGSNPTLVDSTTATVTSEDLVIRKSAVGQVVQGTFVTSTLVIEASEYRDFTSLVVTDTLPDGLCPVAAVAVSFDADCGTGANPTIDTGSGPLPAPYTSAVENADGTWTLVWDDALAGLTTLAHSSRITITFQSRVRNFYQQNGSPEPGRPILNFDSLTNQVAVEAPDFKRLTIDATSGDPEPDNQLDFDVSSASITGIGPSIDKRVSTRSGVLAGSTNSAANIGNTCRDDNSIVWDDGNPTAVAGFRPGDFVCFDLRASFPAFVDADGVDVEDYLPAQFELVAGSARRVTGGTSPDTLAGTTVAESPGVNDLITFTLESTGQVPSSPTGQQFHWTVAARLIDPALSAAYDINANLMKMTTRNSAGAVFMYRDQSTAEWTEPQVKLDKTNNASGALDAGDTVDYTIKVWNDGNIAAANAEVWDRLPAGITCADVTTSSPTAVCASNILVWDAADIPTVAAVTSLATAPVTLTYTVDLPAGVDPGRVYTNTAGVRRYEAASNATDSPFIYYPSSNIDPIVIPNTGPASDTSQITITAAMIAKVQQSSVNDAFGNAGNVAPATTAERATIGETITYTVTATIPEGTTVIDARIVDALDGDLILDAAPSVVVNGLPDASWVITAPAIGAGGTVQVDRAGTYLNTAASGADVVTLTIVARVRNVGGTVAGSAISNTSSFSHLPSPSIGTTRVTVNGNTVSATVVEPSISISKNENDADDIVVPNDTLIYTLTVSNASGANRSRANDHVVVDTIPAGVTVVNSGVPVVDGGAVNPDGGIWNQAARTITWDTTTTAAKLATVNPGANTTLTYSIVVDDPATSGSIFTNNVTVSATSMIGTVTGERTSYSANATDTVTAPPASVAKSVSPTSATIGDTVTYTIDATVPAGITAYDATVLDTLPDGMDFRAYGTINYTGVSTGCPSIAGAQGIATQTANGDGSTTIGFWIDDFTSPAGNSCTIRITYTARVDNTYVPEGTNVVNNQTLVNSARIHWNSTNSVSSLPANPPAAGSFTAGSNTATATLTVREPVVVIDKDVSQSPCDATPGNVGDNDTCNTDINAGTYTYTLTVRNTSTTWPAHDISVVDAPDADLVNVTVPGSSGAITVVDGTAPNLEWLISTIAPTSTVTITYTAQLAASATLNDGEQIVNTADVPTYYGQPAATRSADPVAEWRTYGQGGAGGDVTADTVTMTVGFPHVTVVKTAISDATDARAGVAFAWRIVATNTATEPTAAAYGVDIDDVLPAGWVYQTGSTSITTPYGTITTDPVCTPDCATPGATLAWSNVISGAGQPLNPGITITVDFNAAPQASLLTIPTTGTFDHTNTAGVAGAEDVTGSSSNADGTYVGPDSTATARIRRTDLSVTKTVSAGPYSFGNEVNWTVVVANAGPDAATGVTLADVLPVGLIYVTTVSASQGTYSSGTGIWTVGTVNNGANATLVIRTRLNQIGAITNRAEVQTSNQWDVDSIPNSQGTVVNEDDDDTVTITAGFTSLGDYVWYDVDGDSLADVSEPGIPGVRVVLESEGLDNTFGTSDDYWGPDGVLGGGDDITVTDATTNGTGFYGFSNLPTGDYRVRVDTTTLPTGMAPTYNDDAPNTADPDLDHRTGLITLNSSTGYLDADFGYTGTGSLGDTIWLDKDASGGATQQIGEPGLPGLDVTLVWGGFDGNLSTTADNITYPIDTTNASGQYLFTLLPAGAYRATVDATDVPTGTNQTFDLDGTTSADTVTTSLTAGQNRLDVDFSYAGDGSIGDRIWYDRDGDGVLDAGETGIANIDVTVVWLGDDGVSGGGDDVLFTTTTDATGTYLIDHLPAGNFNVLVDSGDLPAGMQATYDLDGTGTTHTAAVSLVAGQDRVDVDFGYIGLASIGDKVWFDIDGDGAPAPEPGDPGLAGVTVTVRWAGPDNTFGNTDDVVVITTTDSDGDYLVSDLPYGPVRVTVDSAALVGFDPTFDGDGIGTAYTVEITLTADNGGTVGIDEANRRDADFAYTGTGSIGDLVWEDIDGNGSINATETGLDAVGLTITWAGIDGVTGNGDDVSWTTTTAGGGAYVVDMLPAGSYTVVVNTATVPAGMVSVSELDPTHDSRANAGLTAGQDRRDVDFGYQLQADLSIDKSHTGRFEVGQNGVYTLVVRNVGPASALTPRVTDVLPNGLTFVTAVGTGATCTAVGQSVTCDLLTMAVNDTITITLTVAVGRAAAPGVTNSASVSSPTTDPVPANNTDTDPTEVPLADLSISKRLEGTLVANSTVTYVLEATNLGPSPSGAPIVITDDLPAGLTFVDATSTSASCTSIGQVVTCRSTASVAVGQVVRVDLRVRVTATAGSAIVNNATVTGDPSFGSSVPTDPATSNNAVSTPSSVVSSNLPRTGWDLIQQWTQTALWLIALGGFTVLIGRRRRRPIPMV